MDMNYNILLFNTL